LMFRHMMLSSWTRTGEFLNRKLRRGARSCNFVHSLPPFRSPQISR
jgi:hypothetical protein